jgi:peptidoglycan/LPS O-acetylase OafA/YrhL
VVWRYVYGSEKFLASPGQLVGAAAVAVVLIAVAFACRPTAEPVGHGWVPRSLLLGLGVFVALSVYQVRPESWAGFVVGIVWLAMLAVLLFWFARQRSWGPRHELALVAAALGRTAGSGSCSPSWLSPAIRSAGPGTSCSRQSRLDS